MAKEYVFHYEHYPHYLGTMDNETKVDITELDELSDRYIAAGGRGKAYEKDQELYEDLEATLNGYASYEILDKWPKIRRALETKGVWSDMWEEGSHALSMQNMRDARSEVGKIEARIKQDEFEW